MLNNPQPDDKVQEMQKKNKEAIAAMFVQAFMMGAESQALLTQQPVKKEDLKKTLDKLIKQFGADPK